MTHPSPDEGLELSLIALQVATEASQLVLGGFRGPHSVSLKEGREPVTEFDLHSERLVRARLAALTPNVPMVGEETGGVRGDGLTWYCDPIDGTVNYMRGQPYFAVSLGVARDGVPLGGAVVAPALRLSWRGSRGGAAFRNEAPCHVSSTRELADAVITTGLPTRGKPSAASGLDLLGNVAPAVRDVRRCGSAAIELCMVADGTYDAYFSGALSPWDTCAGAAILSAAGGRVERITSNTGGDYELGDNRLLHQMLRSQLSI